MRPTLPLLLLVLAAALGHAKAEPLRFNRDIRPILSDKCIFCHGPDPKHRGGDLRLDLREEAIQAGALVPGQPAQSEMIKRILTADVDDLMPPPESKKTLSAKEKETLRRWIAEGATYEPHWAYTPLVRPEIKANAPIDALLSRELARHRSGFSPEASRNDLLRRLSLDLTGLPPTPEEVATFVQDRRPDAYDRQVDRLLASPHYGERMAVWWLDAARFSDTVGYHGDQIQRVFPYRDYVIDAFNRNLPFDRFTLEQLAGDLLPNPTLEQRVATGFNRLNMMTREGGAQPKEYLVKYAADRVRTVSGAFLGSTLGCAECHDHKYDPFTLRDFYTLAAYFADVKQWGVYADYGYTPNPDLRGFNNDFPFPPEIEVESPYLMARMRRLEGEMDALAQRALAAAKPEHLAGWREETLAFLNAHPTGWASPAPHLGGQVQEGVTQAEVEADGRVLLLAGNDKEEITLTVTPGQGWLAAVRLEVLPHARHGGRIVRGKAGAATLQLTARWRKAGEKKDTPLNFSFAESATKQPRYSHGQETLGLRPGWRLKADRLQEAQESIWLPERPLRLGPGDTVTFALKPDQAGAVRLSLSPVSHGLAPARPDATMLRAGLAADHRSRTPEQRALLARAWFAGTPQGDWPAFVQLRDAWAECRLGRTHTLVTESWSPRPTRVLARGDWMDETGEIVLPSPPAFLLGRPAMPVVQAKPSTAPEEIVWFEDELPPGGRRPNEPAPTYARAAEGPVFSGERSLRRAAPGLAQDVYLNGRDRFTLPATPRLFAHVHLDPGQLPQAIMLQFHVNGSWEHRAVWGDPQAILYGGAPGGPAKAPQGPLPKAGEWVRLEVDAAAVGLQEGDEIAGFAYTQFGGLVHWDRAGVVTGGASSPPEPRLTRADLAAWITSPQNPLTARAVANRIWKLFFGHGLSAIVDDLGGQGEPPSHPELLDWLAAEFQSSGWDVKHLVRTLVRSAAYRQRASLRPEMREIDPLNRLYSSQNPRRLDAEFVRDNALAIAGLLNRDLGGPSAKPYQPPGYYSQLQFPDRDYVAHADDRQWRRGLYMHWQRTFLHPMLANFDAPSREESVCARNVSNTPQQALTLLNDPTFVEAARALAGRVLEGTGDDAARIRRAFELALARPAKPREWESLSRLLAEHRTHFAAAPEEARKFIAIGLHPAPAGVEPAELAAWTSVCRVVLNLHETITRY
jgi:hypothetical protein